MKEMKEMIERVRSFETDHAPDGWPAIRMREVSALADAIADLQRELDNERARGIHTCHDDCTRAGCVNRRLREQIEELKAEVEQWKANSRENKLIAEQLAAPYKLEIEELAAALAAKDEALKVAYHMIADDACPIGWNVDRIWEALALQPHASILNKIRAEAVREAAKICDSVGNHDNGYRCAADLYSFAQRIEKGEA